MLIISRFRTGELSVPSSDNSGVLMVSHSSHITLYLAVSDDNRFLKYWTLCSSSPLSPTHEKYANGTNPENITQYPLM